MLKVGIVGINELSLRAIRNFEFFADMELSGVVADCIPDEWKGKEAFLPFDIYTNVSEMLNSETPEILLIFKKNSEIVDVDIPSGVSVLEMPEGTHAEALMDRVMAVIDRVPEIEYEELTDHILRMAVDSGLISAYTDCEPVIYRLLDRVLLMTDAKSVIVMIAGGYDRRTFTVKMARGQGSSSVIGNKIFMEKGPLLESIEMLSIKTFKPTVGLSSEFSFLEDMLSGSISDDSEIMIIPLREEIGYIGALLIHKSKGAFKFHEKSVAMMVGSYISLAIRLAKLYADIELHSTFDMTTGTYNSNRFFSKLSEELKRARRYSLNLCMILIEIDEFDSYIDKCGNTLADLVIADIGNILKKNTREVDIVARISRERFAVLLPETRRLGSVRLAERIRRVVEEYPFPSNEKGISENVSVCAGIASFPLHGQTDEEAMFAAKAALEEAKKAGPNQIRLFSKGMKVNTGSSRH